MPTHNLRHGWHYDSHAEELPADIGLPPEDAAVLRREDQEILLKEDGSIQITLPGRTTKISLLLPDGGFVTARPGDGTFMVNITPANDDYF